MIQLQKKAGAVALFLCISLLAGLFPMPAAATDTQRRRFGDIVNFVSIRLYENADGKPGAQIEENALLGKDSRMMLYYTYEITTKEKILQIEPGVRYELQISPHLVLPDLKDGRELAIEEEGQGKVEFARLYADGKSAWIEFLENREGNGTVLAEYDELLGAYFYLDCGRAPEPPEDEPPAEQACNRYVMKFENGEALSFGYAEDEPVWSKAKLAKNGSVSNKSITWTIDYTPWQNPKPEDGVSADMPFELRDTIEGAKHRYAAGSAKIDGVTAAAYTDRSSIPQQAEAYVLLETVDEDQILSFGGTKLCAGQATGKNPAKPLRITYETEIVDEILLPGNSGGQSIQNEIGLFAQKDGEFQALDVKAAKTIQIPKPKWLEKKGTTTRHPDGTGSETEWTVTFFPNGFTFGDENGLTLFDKLPAGSTLVEDSVRASQGQAQLQMDTGSNGFTVSGLSASGSQPVSVTYRTVVPEEMYDSGTNLGDNRAWFTFRYDGGDYQTPEMKAPVNSGDGSGSSGTATLLKSSRVYDAPSRSISWTVTVNPHKADFKSGTFVDDLKAGSKDCGILGHSGGMELAGGVDAVAVQLDGQKPADDKLVKLDYDNGRLTVTVGNIGRSILTLTYTAKISDPCIFAANTPKTVFKNTIASDNMVIGQSTEPRSASASATAEVSAAVLAKKEPVYHYADGSMEWTVEVNASGLAMEDICLTDELPQGLSYKADSLRTSPELPGATETVTGQQLTLALGEVSQKTNVIFTTQVDPQIFNNDSGTVMVTNTVRMTGKADGAEFQEVSHTVSKSFTNHGLVKNSKPQLDQELIAYEVLINPYGLKLPQDAALVDTLDRRLQLDMDTLRFYPAQVSGTAAAAAQKPEYKKIGEGQILQAETYDLEKNSFRVRLPVAEDDMGTYVLAYTADIIKLEKGSYSNSVSFDGSSVLLGGSKNNSVSVAGGGGGGGGGVAARKAGIAVTKKDSETGQPLEGVAFTLFQWDDAKQERGLAVARAETDGSGRAVFQVKPNAIYELEETAGLSGYDPIPGWTALPAEAVPAENGILRITAGAAKSTVQLELTNQPDKTEGPDGSGGGDDGDTGNGSGTGDGGNDGDAGSGNGTDGGSNDGDASNGSGTGDGSNNGDTSSGNGSGTGSGDVGNGNGIGNDSNAGNDNNAGNGSNGDGTGNGNGTGDGGNGSGNDSGSNSSGIGNGNGDGSGNANTGNGSGSNSSNTGSVGSGGSDSSTGSGNANSGSDDSIASDNDIAAGSDADSSDTLDVDNITVENDDNHNESSDDQKENHSDPSGDTENNSGTGSKDIAGAGTEGKNSGKAQNSRPGGTVGKKGGNGAKAKGSSSGADGSGPKNQDSSASADGSIGGDSFGMSDGSMNYNGLENGEDPLYDPKIPKTGDRTVLLLGLFLLSGVVLATMSFIRFWSGNEKKAR